jgi:hypothetical protein
MIGISAAFSVAWLVHRPDHMHDNFFYEQHSAHNTVETPASPAASVNELGDTMAPTRLFYSPVSPDVIFKDLPPRFQRAHVEYEHAEYVARGPNRTIERKIIPFDAPWAREFIFGPSELPPIFLINLDKSKSRL